MVKYELADSDFAASPRKIKRVSSYQSLSTIVDSDKLAQSRMIPLEVKAQFIDLITRRNFSMKQAAKMVKMSYSTAKKIYGRFRRNNMEKLVSQAEQGSVVCSYAPLPDSLAPRILVVSTVAGNTQH